MHYPYIDNTPCYKENIMSFSVHRNIFVIKTTTNLYCTRKGIIRFLRYQYSQGDFRLVSQTKIATMIF